MEAVREIAEAREVAAEEWVAVVEEEQVRAVNAYAPVAGLPFRTAKVCHVSI